MIPYSTQTIFNSDIKGVNKVLKSKWLTQGPLVNKFENRLSKIVKSKYSVAVNSGTSALHISCLALGLKPGDILWTVPNTFVASANCGLLVGGKVDFVDININSFNIDTNLLEKKLIQAKEKNKLPKVLVTVHFGGQPTEQDVIWRLSKKFKFKILEDASHALGAFYKKEPVGSCKWSDITVFSFHPVKTITTCEGGAATTNNLELYNKLRIFSNHGITKKKQFFKIKTNNSWHYEQHELGLNYRMSEISASLGITQLQNLKRFVILRNKVAKLYYKKLKADFIQLPVISKYCISSFHLFVIKIIGQSEDYHRKFFNFLRKKKINVNVHYIPVHLQPYYRKLGFKENLFKNSEKHATSSISIPIFPSLKKKEMFKIIKLINNYSN